MKDDLMIAGYHVSIPSIDIHTIGAGGGTIAGVDPAGMLYVGPQGAGAHPGPACYGLGGTEPTVTDAQLVLGRLRPGAYAASGLSLDQDAARKAIETRVAQPLGLSVEDAAAGIIALLEQNLLHAVEYISIERGHAPRRFTLVAAGGAGPMHGANVARGLGCRRVYVPRDAGALCAIGMLHADVRQDFQTYIKGKLDELEPGHVDGELAKLGDQAHAALYAEGFGPDQVVLECAMDLHYRGQLWSIRVPLAEQNFSAAETRRAFEAEYQRLYGHVQPDGVIMAASLRVAARAATGTPKARRIGGRPLYAQRQSDRSRSISHDKHGWLDVPIYDGSELGAGARVSGPAVIEERTTTVLLGPGEGLTVDATGNFMIEVAPDRSRVPASAGNRARARSRHPGAGAEPARPHLAPHGLGDDAHGAQPDLQPEPRLLLLHHRRARHADQPGRRHPDPYRRRRLPFAPCSRHSRPDIAGRTCSSFSDPYAAGGNHLPDWVIARPVFVEGALVAFACNRAHQSDIGGGAAGTYNSAATEIFHEGIRLPVLKLIEGGKTREDLWRLLLLNTAVRRTCLTATCAR